MKITANHIKTLLLLSYFVNEAMARINNNNAPKTLGSGLTYELSSDRDFPAVNFKTTDHQIKSIQPHPFKAFTPGLEFVLSGSHLATTNSRRHAFWGGFEWKNIIKVTDRSLNPGLRNPVDYLLPPCEKIASNEKPFFIYQSVIFGLTDEECENFGQNFDKRVGHLMGRYRSNEIFFYTLMGLAGLLILLAAGPFIQREILSYRMPRPIQGDIEAQPLIRALEIIKNIPKLADTPRISASLKNYLKSIDENDTTRVSNLSENEKDDLVKKYKGDTTAHLECPISITLIDAPVLLNGRTYDFSSLVAMKSKIDPIEKDEDSQNIPFSLSDLQADLRSNQIIRNEIESIIKNRAQNQGLSH